MEAHGSGLRRVLLLSFCVAGIWAAYIYQGVLQETLSTKKFGEDGKRFEHLAFLNLAQNVICLVWSYLNIQNTEGFRNCTGPSIVVDLLSDSSSDSYSLDAGFAVVAAAATGNEVVKQSFMELKINQLILQVLNRESLWLCMNFRQIRDCNSPLRSTAGRDWL